MNTTPLIEDERALNRLTPLLETNLRLQQVNRALREMVDFWREVGYPERAAELEAQLKRLETQRG